jgi:sec-independent protein translocase protein TatA
VSPSNSIIISETDFNSLEQGPSLCICIKTHYYLTMGIVAGTEWIVIIVVIGALIFGAKKIPDLARSFGRASSEYEKARIEAKNELERIKNPSSLTPQNDREKLDTLGIKYSDKNIDELRTAIQAEIGRDKKTT